MDEKLASLMQEARLITAAEHLLFPYLEKVVSNKLAVLCSKFSSGEKDLIPEIAYITAVRDLVDTLKRTREQGNRAFDKFNQIQLDQKD